MAVEHTFYCDAEECNRHVQTRKTQPPTFITTTEEGSENHFCSWDCVLKHAATIPPETVVHLDDGGEANDAR